MSAIRDHIWQARPHKKCHLEPALFGSQSINRTLHEPDHVASERVTDVRSMAFERPVVCSDIDAIPEALTDGVAPRDGGGVWMCGGSPKTVWSAEGFVYGSI